MPNTWEYQVSQGDINNGNIRFASCPFPIAPIFFGGTNDSEPAKSRILVTFVPGDTSEQWLYSDKKLMNNRNPRTKDFFAAIGAIEKTKIRITQTAPDALLIEKA